MADVAAVLDTAGLAGLQAGKKGHKKTGQGTGPADFVLALISQMSVGDAAKGKALKLAAGAADADADVLGGGRADRLITASSQGGKAPAGSFPDETAAMESPTPADSRDEDGQVAEASSPAPSPLEPAPLASQAPLAAMLAPTMPSPSAPQSLPDAESASSSSAPLETVVQAIAANTAKEAPAASADELSTPVLTASHPAPGDSKKPGAESLKTGSSPALSANAADGAGKNGQVLPAFDADMAHNDPGASQNQPEGMANGTVVANGSSGVHASLEATMARPFDQVLRHMETRLNVAVEAHIKSPVFANELGEKIVWLAGRNGQIAELTLNPPQMGSVEIRLTVAGGEAGALFFSANPVVREALETALPKLRELMAQAGINLGEANVRDQSFTQGKAAERAEAGASPLFPGSEAANKAMHLGSLRSGGLGLVDLYA